MTLPHIIQGVLLRFGRAAQIAVRAQTGANRAADQPEAIPTRVSRELGQCARVFDGDLDGLKPPALELFEELSAAVGER